MASQFPSQGEVSGCVLGKLVANRNMVLHLNPLLIALALAVGCIEDANKYSLNTC